MCYIVVLLAKADEGLCVLVLILLVNGIVVAFVKTMFASIESTMHRHKRKDSEVGFIFLNCFYCP